MQFKTQTFTISDLYNWWRAEGLTLQPKFQRRLVWSGAARSFLVDTAFRGLPMPKIYFRMQVDPESMSSLREIVDGQQRLTALFDYLDDEFAVYRSHNSLIGGKRFSQLSLSQQSQILSYDISADLLIGAADADVLQIFARINSYSITLNAQERRNARYFGTFKATMYDLGTEHVEFWVGRRILTNQQIARMKEAELTSELVIALMNGLQDKKGSIDEFYEKFEDSFPGRASVVRKFQRVLTWLDLNIGDAIASTAFNRVALFYSLYMAVADALFGIPGGVGPMDSVPSRQLEAPSANKLSESLAALSKGVRAKVPPAKYAKFAVAASSQTDNIGPRKTRHAELIRLLTDI